MSLSLEALAAKGIILVKHVEGELARFERVSNVGTQVFQSDTLEKALAIVEEHLAQHPGALGTDISRSDGASESRDVQVQHSAEVGPSDLPAPAADAAAAASAEPESNTGPGPNVESADAEQERADAAAAEAELAVAPAPAEPAADGASEAVATEPAAAPAVPTEVTPAA